MKVWISSLILFLAAASGAFAQAPANDNCANATPLTVNTTTTCTPATFTNIGATTQATDPVAPICWGPATLSHNVWFSFVPTTSAVTITTSAATGPAALTNSQLAVYSGTCGSLTQVACNENASTTNLHAQVTATALTPGATYYIMVDGNTNLTGTFGICVQAISQPNDNCANATPLTVGNNTCTPSTFSNMGATSQASDPTPTCWSPATANHNVWFSFVATGTQVQVSTNFYGTGYSLTNTQTAVYSGTCGSLTQIACNEDIGPGSTQTQFLAAGLTPGTTYYIMVDGNGIAQGSFGICVQNITVTNDNCANAISLPVTSGSCSSPVFTNTGATTDPSDPAAACFSPTGLSNTVWFSFTATSASVEISTNFSGPAFTLANTQAAVYSGTCAGLTYIACEEDINTNTGLLHTNFQVHGLTVGNTYYIMIDGNGADTGTFGLCVQSITTPPPPPIPNSCATAQPAIPGCPITVANGNIGPGPSTTFTPTCFGNGTTTGMQSPWMYTFTAATSGTFGFTVTPTSPIDYDIALFDITNGCPLGAGGTAGGSGAIEIACNWSGVGGVTGVGCSAGPCAPMANIVAGQTYLIIVDRYTSSSTAGFTLTFPGSATPAPPNAAFTFTPACTNSPVQFTNTTPGAGTMTNSWNFGDGSTSNAVNPTHTYAAAGTYAVTLTTSYTCGSGPNPTVISSSVTHLVTVNDPPFSNFSVTSPVCVGQPSTIEYTGPPLAGATYNWTVDGGNIVSGTGTDSLQVTWATDGIKNITLQIYLGTCTTTVNTLLVEVLPLPVVDVNPANSAICSGQAVTLNATGAVSYSWAPAAGLVTPNSNATVSVTPPSQTTYTVFGTAPNGCVASDTAVVDVDIFQLLFRESMGTVLLTTPINVHEVNAGFDNDQLFMSGTGDVRGSLASSGYAEASGGANVFLNFNNPNNPDYVFQIDDINTFGMTNLELSFGVRKNTTGATGGELAIEASIDNGATWTSVGSPVLPTNSTSNQTWHYVTVPGGAIPAAQDLALRFKQTASTVQFRLDDILLRNPSVAPVIIPSGPLSFCGGGSVNLTSSGANNFLWSTGDTSQVITITQGGTYTVTVADANNCVKTSAPVVVSTTGTPPPVATNMGPVCAGQPLQLSASGDPALAYTWTGPGTFTSTDQNPLIPAITAAGAGIYTVTVSNPACGPTATASDTTLVVLSSGAVSLSYPFSTYCVTSADTALAVISVPASSGVFTSSPAGLAIDTTGAIVIANSTVGSYWVTFTTTGACSSADSVQVSIVSSPSADFAYADTAYCQSQPNPAPVFAAGASAGAFTASPSGLVFVSTTTGVVDLAASAPGLYTIINTIPAQGGCAPAADTTQLTVLLSPAAPALTSSGPVCEGTAVQLSAAGDTTFSYSWTGPNGFTSFDQNTLATGLAAGAHVFSATVTAAGCTSPAGTVTVTVDPIPATPVLSSNPVCAGSTLTVSVTNPLSGATYAWTGPNGALAATGPTVTIPSATLADGGTYTAVATSAAGCVSAAGTISAVVTSAPSAPVASSNSPVCTGQMLQLSASAIAGATYSWTGPAGFSSTLQDPVRPSAQVAHAGTYSVYALLNGCISPAGTVVVSVSPVPATPVLSSNSPVCQGTQLTLQAQGAAGATFNWTAPNNSGSYTGQTVTLPNAPATANGVWTATQTINGCTSAAGGVQVTVNPAPAAPVVTSNSPVCQGQTLTLSTVLVPGALYTWTAPSGAMHLGQILSVTNAMPADSGLYTLITTLNGCVSPPTVVNAIVAPQPATPAIFSNSPVCAGQTLTLSTAPVAGASYNWSGPQGSYQTQVVTIPGPTPVTPAYTGTYSLVVTSSYGCISSVSTAQITVTPTPATPVITSNAPVCEGDTLTFSATGNWSSSATFSWSGPNGYGTTLQHPVRANAIPAYSGNYTLVVTENGCSSLPGVISVIVNPAPVLNAVSNNGPLCTGATLQLTANSFANASYTWTGPNNFFSNLQNPTITNVTTAHAGDYTVSVINSNGCQNLFPAVTNVVVHPTPVVDATATTPLCVGNSLLLTATTSTTGATYSWAGPLGFTSTVYNPTVPNVQLSSGGTYHVWVTANGCTGEDTVHVVVHPQPSAPVPTSNSPICAEQTLQLFAGGPPAGPTVAYSWSGPNNFASTVKDPVIANATVAAQGNYFVTVFVNGCPSPAGIVQVTVHPVPNMSITQSNPLICEGQSSTLTASGTGAISHSWTPTTGLSPATGLIVTATPAVTTTYSLLSTNSQGCVSTDTITVTVLPAVQANAGADQTGLCPATSTTLAAVVPATGTGAWSIASGTGGTIQNPLQANSLFTGQLNQSYQLVWTVTNPPCAPVTDTVQIDFFSSEPQPQVTINNSPICQGQTLQLATGLVPGATYTWTGPLGTYFGQGLIITSATAAHSGTYTLHYTTSTGCQSAPVLVPFTVTPLPAAPVFTSNSPLCAGNTLSFTAATVANATYSWTGPNSFQSQVQNPTIPNVTAAHSGPYTLIVSVNGCSSLPSIQQVQVLPAVLQPQATSNSPVCEGGTLLLTASASASANATYSWVGPNNFASAQQNPQLSSVTAAQSGTYTVYVLAGGCTSTAGTVTVTVETAPAVPLAGNNGPLCEGATLTLSVTNPVGAAVYNWFNPDGSPLGTGPVQTIQNATAAQSGTYQVSIVGSNGCSQPAFGNTAVVISASPIVGISSNSPVCQGTTLQLNATAGAGATYSWTGPNNFSSPLPNPSILNAQPTVHSGTYQVFVTQNGCTKDSSVAVVVGAQPTAPVVSPLLSICSGETLQLSANGVYPPGSTFSWTGPNNFSSTQQHPAIPNATLAAQGSYNVWVFVGSCASSPALSIVEVKPVPQASVTAAQSTICIGQSTALTATGASFSYSWAADPTLSATNTATVTATPTVTTTYTVYSANSNGGCPDIDTIQVVVNTPAVADAGADQPALCGTTAQLSALAGNGTGLWTVVTGTGGSFADPDSASTAFTGQAGQSYTLAWTIQNAPCPAETDQVEVSFLDAVAAPVASGALLCKADSVTLTATVAGAGIINWYSDTTAAPVGTGDSFNTPVLAATDTFYVAAMSGICQSAFVPVVVTVGAPPVVEAGLAMQIEIGQTVQLLASGTSGVSYSWTPGANLIGAGTASPIAQPLETTLYTVTATNALGCEASDTVRVSVIPLLVIPNGFTPNGDGQNDVWELTAITEGHPDARVEIFNRWGGIVYSSKGYSKPFDGKLNGEDLPTSTYYYIIYLGPGQAPLSGSVTIIR